MAWQPVQVPVDSLPILLACLLSGTLVTPGRKG